MNTPLFSRSRSGHFGKDRRPVNLPLRRFSESFLKRCCRFAALLTAAILLLNMLLLTACGGAAAASMHLKQTEGTVHVTDGEDKALTPEQDLALYSGYRVGTAAKSYAWVDLDKAKLTKLDENSEIEIQKEGRALKIEVASGSLFFNVTEPLADDETMEICTSSMLVGIRGTCGWVNVPDAGRMEVSLLEGSVMCTAGENTAAVHAGEKAEMTAEGEITVFAFTPEEIPPFAAREIKNDGALLTAIREASGLDLAAHPMVLYGDVLSEIYGTILSTESIDLDADGSEELMVLWSEEDSDRIFVYSNIYRTGPEGLTYSGGSSEIFYMQDRTVHSGSVSLVESGGRLYEKWHTVWASVWDGGNTYTREEDYYFGFAPAETGDPNAWIPIERFWHGQDIYEGGDTHDSYSKSIALYESSDHTNISAEEYEAGLAKYHEIRMLAYAQDDGEIVVVSGPAGE